ncbi:MAG: MBL fold metallo-hydrolase [Tumebacillaceae bacterium]
MMKKFELQPLANGVYAALAFPGTGAFANAGFVDLGDGVVVFDTFATPDAGAELKQTAEEVTGKKVPHVVNSHEHFAHIHGNHAFPDAVIISTARTREIMAERRPAFVEYAKAHPEFFDNLQAEIDQQHDPLKRRELESVYAEFLAVNKALNHIEIKLPTVTFDDHLTLHGSQRSVELFCYGGGHTPSDAILYIPDAKVILAADLLHVGYHVPFVYPEEFVDNLEKVLLLDADTYVPGHGHVGTRADVLATQAYIRHLLERVETFTGDPAEVIIPEPYAEWEAPGIYSNNLKKLLNRG